jgi:hypothetical protein
VAGGLIVWNNVKELHSPKAGALFGAGVDDDLVPAGSGAAGAAQRGDADVLIMGDGVEIDGGAIAYDEPVPVSRLFPAARDTIVRGVAMDRLGRFLEIVNHVGLRSGLFAEGKQVQLTEQLRAHVGRQVRGEFATMAVLDPINRVVEPAFVSEIRNLLEVLTHEG